MRVADFPATDQPVEFKRFVAALGRHGNLKAFESDETAFRAGMWLKAVLHRDDAAAAWCARAGLMIVKEQREAVNSAGGFVVPFEVAQRIIDLRELAGVFRANAYVEPMGTDVTFVPRRAAGLTAYMLGESVQVTESQMTFDQVGLTARKIGALARFSAEVTEDTLISLADRFAVEMAFALAVKEDDIGFNGDGTSSAGGFRGLTTLIADGAHNAGKVAAASGHNSYATIDATDISKLMATLPAYAISNAKWYVHQVGVGQVFARLGQQSSALTVTADANGKQIGYYLGFPIVMSQRLPSTFSTFTTGQPILFFGDLSRSSTLGSRRELTIRVADERYIEFNQIGVLGTERVAIVNHDLGDNTNVGAIVGLVSP